MVLDILVNNVALWGHRRHAKRLGSHIPFKIDTSKPVPIAHFHVTAGNGLAAIPDGTKCLLAVWGPDAYVSNDWYATPDHVSTWLYEAVHLSGPVRRLCFEDNRKHGDEFLEAFEARLLPKTPWDLETMEPAKREAMLRSIVVLEMEIERVEGQRKLSQHKSDEDHDSVARHLFATGEPGAIAEKMRALRPHLDYSNANCMRMRALNPEEGTPDRCRRSN
jgi:transcriptional regulator